MELQASTEGQGRENTERYFLLRIQESLHTAPNQAMPKTVSQVKAPTTEKHSRKAERDLPRLSLKARIFKKNMTFM